MIEADNDMLNSLLEFKKEDLADFDIGLLIDKDLIDERKDELDSYVSESLFINYLDKDCEKNEIMVKLILPILKPDFKSDETLSNIGAIADLIGIPAVSTIIDVYVNGRDLKATLEEEEKGATSYATIISDIAYILGFDSVGDVANLVNDVDGIKSAIDKDAGNYEKKGGIDSAKDIVDVVSDIIDK